MIQNITKPRKWISLHLSINPKPMSDIQILINELTKFRDERNWSQFHKTKDLALAISIEAAELNVPGRNR